MGRDSETQHRYFAGTKKNHISAFVDRGSDKQMQEPVNLNVVKVEYPFNLET